MNLQAVLDLYSANPGAILPTRRLDSPGRRDYSAAMDTGVRITNRVREMRRACGLRQADLAREVGITRQTIIAIEKGRLTPSVLIALKLASVLGEPVERIFALTEAEETFEIVAKPGLETGDSNGEAASDTGDTRQKEPRPTQGFWDFV